MLRFGGIGKRRTEQFFNDLYQGDFPEDKKHAREPEVAEALLWRNYYLQKALAERSYELDLRQFNIAACALDMMMNQAKSHAYIKELYGHSDFGGRAVIDTTVKNIRRTLIHGNPNLRGMPRFNRIVDTLHGDSLNDTPVISRQEFLDRFPPDMEGADWRDSALCIEIGPTLFFPDRRYGPAAGKKVCELCEVRAQCLVDALGGVESAGMRAGLPEYIIAERRARKHAQGLRSSI